VLVRARNVERTVGAKIHVDAQRGGLRHDVSDLTLEAIARARYGIVYWN
jgi:hypothetical protein